MVAVVLLPAEAQALKKALDGDNGVMTLAEMQALVRGRQRLSQAIDGSAVAAR